VINLKQKPDGRRRGVVKNSRFDFISPVAQKRADIDLNRLFPVRNLRHLDELAVNPQLDAPRASQSETRGMRPTGKIQLMTKAGVETNNVMQG
jgi:hypothetical protein